MLASTGACYEKVFRPKLYNTTFRNDINVAVGQLYKIPRKTTRQTEFCFYDKKKNITAEVIILYRTLNCTDILA